MKTVHKHELVRYVRHNDVWLNGETHDICYCACGFTAYPDNTFGYPIIRTIETSD